MQLHGVALTLDRCDGAVMPCIGRVDQLRMRLNVATQAQVDLRQHSSPMSALASALFEDGVGASSAIVDALPVHVSQKSVFPALYG